jgi:hypothetical protein
VIGIGYRGRDTYDRRTDQRALQYSVGVVVSPIVATLVLVAIPAATVVAEFPRHLGADHGFEEVVEGPANREFEGP